MSASLVRFRKAKTVYVLDTWPVMEWLKDRVPAADRFEEFIDLAERREIVLLMSRINLGEVFYNSAREWGLTRAEAILADMLTMPITYVVATDEEVDAASRLKAVERISYADAFAASLALRRGCGLITGDDDFRAMRSTVGLRIEWLGA